PAREVRMIRLCLAKPWWHTVEFAWRECSDLNRRRVVHRRVWFGHQVRRVWVLEAGPVEERPFGCHRAFDRGDGTFRGPFAVVHLEGDVPRVTALGRVRLRGPWLEV